MDEQAKQFIDRYNQLFDTVMPKNEFNLFHARAMIYEQKKVCNAEFEDLMEIIEGFSKIKDYTDTQVGFNMQTIRNHIGAYRYDVMVGGENAEISDI